MKRRSILALMLSAFAAPLMAAPSSLAGRLDLLLERQDAAQPGLAIVVLEDGNVLYQRSKGTANKEPISGSTVFPLGSLSQAYQTGSKGSADSLAQLVRSRHGKQADFFHCSDRDGHFHILYGNTTRNLYVIVLSNGGATTAALARQVVDTVRQMYEQPTPQM